MRRLVTPNAAASRRTLLLLAGFESVLAIAIWSASPTTFIPSPLEVLQALRTLWMRHGLSHELLSSFVLNAQSLVMATVLSLVLSYATVLALFRPVASAVSKGRFLGMAGLTLIFTLWIGGGRPLKLSLLVLAISVFFTTSMTAVVAGLPKNAFDYARTLGFSEWRVAWEVVVRGTMGDALELVRQNAAIGWMMLTTVEGISRAEGGLGALLLNQHKHFHIAEVFAIQLVVVAVGIAQDFGLSALRSIVCPWATAGKERS
jgi:NitT/TauT family transport system permease protein